MKRTSSNNEKRAERRSLAPNAELDLKPISRTPAPARHLRRRPDIGDETGAEFVSVSMCVLVLRSCVCVRRAPSSHSHRSIFFRPFLSFPSLPLLFGRSLSNGCQISVPPLRLADNDSDFGMSAEIRPPLSLSFSFFRNGVGSFVRRRP